MVIVYWLILAILCGVLGRMGGANGFNKLFRRIGCSLLVCVPLISLIPLPLILAVFVLHWLTLSTYWDFIFGKDHLYFSGAMVGLAMTPILFSNPDLGFLVFARVCFLAWFWGMINEQLPDRLLWWRRDVAEEFIRYAVLILFLPVGKII